MAAWPTAMPSLTADSLTVELEVAMGTINLSRVYDHDRFTSGKIYLIERLWPRGVRRESVDLDDWLKDVAPSTELRKWFSHDPAKWQDFQRRYVAELDAHPQAWQPLVDAAADHDVVLLYSSRDREHNNAVVLRDYLNDHLRRTQSGNTK